MHTFRAVVGTFAFFAVTVFAPLATAQPVVAVFNLQSKRVKLGDDALSSISDYIATRLAVTGRFKIVPRSELKRALDAQKKRSYKECYADSCQIEVGKELAAEKSLASQVAKLGKICIVTLTLYDLREAATEAAGTGRGACSEEGVLASVDTALAELTNGARASPRAAAPVAPAPPPSAPPPSAPERVRPPAVATTPSEPRGDLAAKMLDACGSRTPKAKALLEREIAALERLRQLTRPDSPDLPAVLLRLSEAYATLGAFEKLAQVSEQFLEAHPNHARVDDAQWCLVQAQVKLGLLREARSAAYTLIKNQPSSKHIPRAYLMFGELFFAEARTDVGKLDLAKQAYAEATKYPTPRETPAFGHYMLGHVAWREGKLDEARDRFSKAMDLTNRQLGPLAKEVFAAARSDYERITGR